MPRPRVTDPQDLISIQAARDAGLLWKQIIYRLGISRRSAYRAVANWHRAEIERVSGCRVDPGHAPCDHSRHSRS